MKEYQTREAHPAHCKHRCKCCGELHQCDCICTHPNCNCKPSEQK